MTGGRSFPLALPLALTFALGGCGSTRPENALPQTQLIDADPEAGPDARPFYAGTAEERRAIAARIEDLRRAQGDDLMAALRDLAASGEPAVPPLVDALRDEDPRLRAHAAWLLGLRRDRRTIPALVRAAADPVVTVRYEASASLLEMADDRGLDALIEGLSDPDARMRARCIDVVESRLGVRFGYEPDAAPAEREEAVRRFRAWREARRPPP